MAENVLVSKSCEEKSIYLMIGSKFLGKYLSEPVWFGGVFDVILRFITSWKSRLKALGMNLKKKEPSWKGYANFHPISGLFSQLLSS